MINKNGNVLMVRPSKPIVIIGGEKLVNLDIIVSKTNHRIFPDSTDYLH